jgi:hypothetical protein
MNGGARQLRASEAQQAEARPQREDAASVVPFATRTRAALGTNSIIAPSAPGADDPAAIQATTAFTDTFTRV